VDYFCEERLIVEDRALQESYILWRAVLHAAMEPHGDEPA